MKRINDLLPHAMDALKASPLLFPNNSILKEYDGYVASFAPSVITAGLRATLSFYTDTHKDKRDGKPRRNHILELLRQIYRKIRPTADGATGDDLLTLALRSDTDQRKLKKDLVDCAIALKLVLRNFEQVEKAPAPLPVHENEPQP